jgi:hypothetical protein
MPPAKPKVFAVMLFDPAAVLPLALVLPPKAEPQAL